MQTNVNEKMAQVLIDLAETNTEILKGIERLLVENTNLNKRVKELEDKLGAKV